MHKEDAEVLVGVSHAIEAVVGRNPGETRSLSQNLQGKCFRVPDPLLRTMADSLAHDSGEGNTELLSDRKGYVALVAKLSCQRNVHFHADFKHDDITNFGLEGP